MNLQILEDRAHKIDREVRELKKEIRRMKRTGSTPSLEDVIRVIEKDLPDEIDLDSTIEDVRDRQWLS